MPIFSACLLMVAADGTQSPETTMATAAETVIPTRFVVNNVCCEGFNSSKRAFVMLT